MRIVDRLLIFLVMHLLLVVWISPVLSVSELPAGFQVESEEPTVGLPKATAGVRRIEKEPRSIPGPDGEPLPFKSLDEVLEFLGTAKVIEKKSIAEGTTGATRILLEKDGLRMRAIFRDVSIFKRKMVFDDGTVSFNFRDDAIFECAAFHLNRLLGLYVVPPTVKRKIGGVSGTLQAWVEDAMMEKERLDHGIEPPDQWRWRMQGQLMQIFDNLVYNEDRNLGNMLITEDWLLVLIDHTRAFRRYKQLMKPESIRYCDRHLLENLKNLNLQLLEEHLAKYLTQDQIRTLLKRRDLLVEHIESLIAEHGSRDVLFSFFR
jgi:hypothetical protein